MKSENKLTSDRQPSPRPKPDVSSTSRMLSPAELAQLRQNGKTTAAYAQKEFKENPLKM